MRRFRFFHVPMLVLTCLVLTPQARSDTISGTVKDPSGGVVIGARIEISGGNLSQPVLLSSDESGKFAATDLSAGKYSIRVAKEGFDDLVTTVELLGTADLALKLTIAAQQTSVTVTGKSTAFANSDAIYRQLRSIGLGETFRCENFTLKMDVGTFELKRGTLTLLGLVNKFETGAVFAGQGHFSLKPIATLDTKEMERRAGSSTAEEDFSEAVFRFSPNQFPQFAATFGTRADTPAEASSAFQHWKDKVRHRHELPEGLTEAILESETIDNVDADVLSAIYNPQHPLFFNAYMHGTPHKDLRFFLRMRVGAIPQLDSPEEVGLINFDGGGNGRWHLVFATRQVRASGAHRKFPRGKAAVCHPAVQHRNRHRKERSSVQPGDDHV